MENTYKIRLYTGRIDTKYGVDVASFVDDPNAPKYTTDTAMEKLMSMLSYEEAEDDPVYPGYCDGEIGAFFDYDGYIDVDIPESIVSEILKGGK